MMTTPTINRRDLIATAAGLATGMALGAVPRTTTAAEPSNDRQQFVYCLNTSTIRGQNLDIVAEIETAAKAGYTAIEPWMEKLHAYVAGGGALDDLGRRIRDRGLTVESAIGFAKWIVDDENERRKGLEQARKDMDVLARIGAKRIAAPPSGSTREPGLDLFKAARRYRDLLELGREMGVVPQVEVWGHSKNLSRLGESMFVAIESGHPDACLLPDVYHLYKGGTEFSGLDLLSSHAIQVFHMNDYPADPPREQINDSHRVYPGDGIAPLDQILRSINRHGGRCVLSLELFNRSYWEQDALEVARTGLEKMQASVAKALA